MTLELNLHPKRGNAAGGMFPFSGVLGLTPVRIQGRLTTQRRELRGLDTRRIRVRVRCCEVRESVFGPKTEEVLWQREVDLFNTDRQGRGRTVDRYGAGPSGSGKGKAKAMMGAGDYVSSDEETGTESAGDPEYETVGELDLPFSLEIPRDIPNNCGSQMRLPGFRIVWRLQAVLDYKPVKFVGSRIVKSYTLPLKLLRPVSLERPLSPPSALVGGEADSQVECIWSGVPDDVGPGDLLNLAFGLRLRRLSNQPTEPAGMVVDRVQVTLQRTMLTQAKPIAVVAPISDGPKQSRRGRPTTAHGRFGRSVSDLSVRRTSDPLPATMPDAPPPYAESAAPVLARPPKQGEPLVSDLASAQCSPGVQLYTSDAVWTKIPFRVPTVDHGWDIGESMTTGQATVAFALHVTLFTSQLSLSASGVASLTSLKPIALPPIALNMVAYPADLRNQLYVQCAELETPSSAGWSHADGGSRSSSSSRGPWRTTSEDPLISGAAGLRPKKSAVGLYALDNRAMDWTPPVLSVTSPSTFSIPSLGPAESGAPALPTRLPTIAAIPLPRYDMPAPTGRPSTSPGLLPGLSYSDGARRDFDRSRGTSSSGQSSPLAAPSRKPSLGPIGGAVAEKSPSRKLTPSISWFGGASFKRRPSSTPSEEENLPARSRQKVDSLLN